MRVLSLVCFFLLVNVWLSIGQTPLTYTDSVFQSFDLLETADLKLEYLDSLFANNDYQEQPGVDTLIYTWLTLANELYSIEENKVRGKKAGELLVHFRKNDRAKKWLQPFFVYKDQWNNQATRIDFMTLEAQILADLYEYKAANQLFAKLDSIYEQTAFSDTVKLARFYLIYGKSLTGTGAYAQANVTLNQSLALYKQLRDSTSIQDVYNDLGNIFGSIGLYEEAIDNYQERLNHDPQASLYTLAFNFTNIGRCYLEQEKYDQSIYYYKNCLKLDSLPSDAKYIKLYCLNGIIEAFYEMNLPDSVQYYTAQLKAEFKRQGSIEMDAFLVDQAEIFDAIMTGKYAKAETALLQLYETAESQNQSPEMIAYSEQLADCYRRWGRLDQALDYMDVYNTLSDSVRTANKTQALLLYQTAYKTQEKIKENKQLRAENEIQQFKATKTRNRLLLLALSLLLVGGFLFMRQSYQNKLREAVKIERLRNQISEDLHDDVGSILTGLSMSSQMLAYELSEQKEGEVNQIVDLSQKALSGMRDVVWVMNVEKDNWKSLLDRMNEFCLEILPPASITFEIQKEGIDEETELAGLFRKNIFLIFKEAITNIVKHSGASTIHIQLTQQQNELSMQIKDNGKMEKEKYSSSGAGMENMKKRASAINGTLTTEFNDGFLVSFKGIIS